MHSQLLNEGCDQKKETAHTGGCQGEDRGCPEAAGRCLTRKAFVECGQMQETMDDLLSKRDEGGLSKVVEEAEVELAVAEEKRDFTGAAEA